MVFSHVLSYADIISSLAKWLSPLALTPPLSTLVAHLVPYLAYLRRDMGFFSGVAARRYLDKLISERAAQIKGGKASEYTNMPFMRHQKIFGRELLVCGANFSTGKTVLFSARKEHTPYFPVADAVRISMGLPLAYKPYVISTKVPGWPPCGTYVDGGFWNNLPLREIEPPGRPVPQGSASCGVSEATIYKPKTLALRLTIDEPKRVVTVGDVILQMINGIQGSGESQVLGEFEHLTVSLDTRKLSLLEFNPPKPVRIMIRKRSRRAMYRYFGIPPSAEDKDDEDDMLTQNLEKLSACD